MFQGGVDRESGQLEGMEEGQHGWRSEQWPNHVGPYRPHLGCFLRAVRFTKLRQMGLDVYSVAAAWKRDGREQEGIAILETAVSSK